MALYLIIARSAPVLRWGIAAAAALVTMATLPRRLWASQLQRLAFICALIFVFTATGSDGVPPVLQPRGPAPGVEGLPPLPPAQGGYTYVLLHLWIITITHRSVNLAITAATLTFTALQSASLVLVTTPAEEMAVALRWWLTPLRWLGVRTQRIALTLLLSLRFMSLVFEEIRNLSLGLAARGVDWRAQGTGGSVQILGRLCSRLFGNLFNRAENISQAMVARGFRGPEGHRLYLTRSNETSLVANGLALALLVGLCVLSQTAYVK